MRILNNVILQINAHGQGKDGELLDLLRTFISSVLSLFKTRAVWIWIGFDLSNTSSKKILFSKYFLESNDCDFIAIFIHYPQSRGLTKNKNKTRQKKKRGQ